MILKKVQKMENKMGNKKITEKNLYEFLPKIASFYNFYYENQNGKIINRFNQVDYMGERINRICLKKFPRPGRKKGYFWHLVEKNYFDFFSAPEERLFLLDEPLGTREMFYFLDGHIKGIEANRKEAMNEISSLISSSRRGEKIKAIKNCRSLTRLGLKEAKNMVDLAWQK